jgi:RNA polymerase sigma factor (sigma-70 family)
LPLHRKASQPVESKTKTADENNTPDETTKLQQNLASGDFTAFWRLWERHERYLYRVCLRQLGGVPEDAEDALGRLLIKLWESLPRHAGSIKNLSAWLSRSAYNLCVDIHRERRQTSHLTNIETLPLRGASSVLHSIETPEENAMREEVKHSLYQGVTKLRPELRIPFLLHVLHEIPYGEIAEQLAITPETARKRGQLAREFLRYFLEQQVSVTNRSLEPSTSGDLYSMLEASLNDDAGLLSSKRKPAQTVALRLVKVVLDSGIERSFYLHLDHKPRRLSLRIKSVTRYTSDHPSGWKKRLELAQLLYEAGQWKRAIEEYRRVLEKQPQLLDVYLELGNLLDLMDDESDSVENYQKALAVAREPATRHRVRGLLELRQGNYDRAIAQFQEAARLEPDDLLHWRHLAFVYLMEDSTLEALGCFEQVLSINANDSASLTHLPYLLRDLGRTFEAEQYLDRALQQCPENVLSMKYLVDLRCRRRWVFGREGKRTFGLIQRTLRLAEGSPEIQDSLASYHLARGEWLEGIDVLRAFTKAHSASPEGWAYYAKALFQTGDVEAATEAIRRGYRLDAHAWQTNAVACEIFGWQGPSPFLRLLLERMLERFPQRWSAWARAALAWLTGLNDAERAVAISAHAPQLQPRLADAWFQHARVLTLAGRYHEAIVSAEVGWQQLPEEDDGSQSIPAAIGLAENYIFIRALGSEQVWIAEVARRLNAFIDLNPAEGNYWEGKLLELTGERRAAVKSYGIALEHSLFYLLRHDAEKAIARLGTPLPRRTRSFPVR